MKTSLFCLLIIVLSFNTNCRRDQKNAEEAPVECYVDDVSIKPVIIQEMKRDGRVEIIEKNGAGTGATVGALGMGTLAVLTGGMSPALAALGGGTVGGLAGDASGSETRRVSTDCSFRVMLDTLPLVYQGEEDDSSYQNAFIKCTMLHAGDQVDVEITKYCNKKKGTYYSSEKRYKWISGPTKGILN